MNKLYLTLAILLIAVPSYAVTYTITLTTSQDKAMQVLSATPLEWIQNAAEVKANKMIKELVKPRTDKQVDKMTDGEKNAVMNTVDITAERAARGR